MTKKPYDHFSRFYDSYIKLYNYGEWFEYLSTLSLLRTLESKSILDLGCGTGEMLSRFSMCGANVTGVDISDGMLQKAKEKFQNSSMPYEFFHCDIVEFSTEEKYDFIFSTGDCVNYLEQNRFYSLLSKVFDMLKKGCVFTFDMLNPQYLVNNKLDETVTVDNGKIRFKRKIKGSTLETNVFLTNGLRTVTEKHLQYLHEPETTASALKKFGFSEVVCFDILSFKPLNADSEKVQVAARK